MASFVTDTNSGVRNSALWVDNTGESSLETFADLQVSSGNILSGSASQTFSEFRFEAGGLTYRYIGEWTVDFEGSLVAGEVSASGFYDRIEISDGGDLLTTYSGDPLAVDFGSSATGLLPTVIGLLDLVTDLLLGGAEDAFANLHLDATPNLSAIAFAGDDDITGGAGADDLVGEGGADLIEGGAGADTLDGGTGIDTASYADSGARVLVDLANGVASGGDGQGDVLSGFENVVGSDFRDGLNGDGGVNILLGGDGNDALQGNGGADRLFGEEGADYLQGATGNDKLYGGNGADRFYAGAGKDLMVGGEGTDVFEFRVLSDSSAAGGHRDLIFDFDAAAGEKIDLSRIDANSLSVGDQAFSFIGAAGFSGAAGELRFKTDGVSATIFGDVNGDGVADFGIDVANMTSFSVSGTEFML